MNILREGYDGRKRYNGSEEIKTADASECECEWVHE
jgi:hypothetical protein